MKSNAKEPTARKSLALWLKTVEIVELKAPISHALYISILHFDHA